MKLAEGLHNHTEINAKIEAAKEEKSAPIKELLAQITAVVENNDNLVKEPRDTALIVSLKEGLHALIAMIKDQNIRKMHIKLPCLISTQGRSHVQITILELLSNSHHFQYTWTWEKSSQEKSSSKSNTGEEIQEQLYTLDIQWHANPATAENLIL